jgi:hypothetical protein
MDQLAAVPPCRGPSMTMFPSRDERRSSGTAYVQPFHFVVPERLLHYACTHHVENDSSRLLHLELPPTVRGFP